jgi:hypothetical protein
LKRVDGRKERRTEGIEEDGRKGLKRMEGRKEGRKGLKRMDGRKEGKWMNGWKDKREWKINQGRTEGKNG